MIAGDADLIGHTMTDKIEVTQADMDAATKAMQDFLARIYDSDTKGTDNLVEAFAKHRREGCYDVAQTIRARDITEIWRNAKT